MAHGTAFECAAIQDVLVASGGLDDVTSRELKLKFERVVSRLTRMAIKFDSIGESSVDYAVAIDYEHEREPELGRAPKGGLQDFTNGQSIFPAR